VARRCLGLIYRFFRAKQREKALYKLLPGELLDQIGSLRNTWRQMAHAAALFFKIFVDWAIPENYSLFRQGEASS
jgi:hypothetical protein